MFHRARDASKVALVGLVDLLSDEHADRRVLDMQWRTPHLASLGVVEVPRPAYLRAARADALPPFACRPTFAGASDDQRVAVSLTIGRPASTQSIIPPARLTASKPFAAGTPGLRGPAADLAHHEALRRQLVEPAGSRAAGCARRRRCGRAATRRARDVEDGEALGERVGLVRRDGRNGAFDHHRRLLQQLRHPPVGERLAAGLAGGAVLQARVGEGHLADRVAADRALLAGAAVHGHVCSSSRP